MKILTVSFFGTLMLLVMLIFSFQTNWKAEGVIAGRRRKIATQAPPRSSVEQIDSWSAEHRVVLINLRKLLKIIPYLTFENIDNSSITSNTLKSDIQENDADTSTNPIDIPTLGTTSFENISVNDQSTDIISSTTSTADSPLKSIDETDDSDSKTSTSFSMPSLATELITNQNDNHSVITEINGIESSAISHKNNIVAEETTIISNLLNNLTTKPTLSVDNSANLGMTSSTISEISGKNINELQNCTENFLNLFQNFSRNFYYAVQPFVGSYLLKDVDPDVKNYLTFITNPDNATIAKNAVIEDLEQFYTNSKDPSITNYLLNMHNKMSSATLKLIKKNQWWYNSWNFYFHPLHYADDNLVSPMPLVKKWNIACDFDENLNFLQQKMNLLEVKSFNRRSRRRIVVPKYLISQVRSTLNFTTLLNKLDEKIIKKNFKGDYYEVLFGNVNIQDYVPVLYGYVAESGNEVKMRFKDKLYNGSTRTCNSNKVQKKSKIKFSVFWGIKSRGDMIDRPDDD